MTRVGKAAQQCKLDKSGVTTYLGVRSAHRRLQPALASIEADSNTTQPPHAPFNYRHQILRSLFLRGGNKSLPRYFSRGCCITANTHTHTHAFIIHHLLGLLRHAPHDADGNFAPSTTTPQHTCLFSPRLPEPLAYD